LCSVDIVQDVNAIRLRNFIFIDFLDFAQLITGLGSTHPTAASAQTAHIFENNILNI
jgi:hypothetical protein